MKFKTSLGNKLKSDIDEHLRGFDNALKLFKKASVHVPAYKDFLKKHKIDPSKIRTENYLLAYLLKDLLWDGNWSGSHIISMSSGSSGKPFFWPRGLNTVTQSAQLHEKIFSQGFDTKNKTTLAVVAFAMGTWIAGTYTISALQQLTKEGHKIVTITPGIMKDEIVKIFKTIAKGFDQVILFGYPPFVKDVIDAAIDEKINIKALNLKLILAGENVSESWRDYQHRHMKTKDSLHTSFTIYGTADAGLLGAETPLSIFIRRRANTNQELLNKIFPNAPILPSLVEYTPELRFFEEVRGDIVLTTNNSLPLVRYAIKDRGKVYSQKQMLEILKEKGISLPRNLRASGDPFVALYGRPDVAATFYALNIYPENVKYGLEVKALEKTVTGKFVIKTEFDPVAQDQSLNIYVELKNGVSPSARLEKQVFKYIFKSLQDNNSEYSKFHQDLNSGSEPIIHLVRFGATVFNVGAKHNWVAKS